MNLERLINAIESLEPSSIPKWGKMSSVQMLKHCNRHTKFYYNQKKRGVLSNLLTLTFGKMHLFYVKYYIRYDINRYSRNSYSPKFLLTSNLQDLDFGHEKKILIEHLKFVHSYNEKFIKSPVHGKVKNSTFKKNIDAHIRYHLDQFGVLKKGD